MRTTIGLIGLLMVGCEDESTKEGDNGTLIFSTVQKTQDDTTWKLNENAPIATHAHFELAIDGWVINSKQFDSSEQEYNAYAVFSEHYNVSDVNTVKSLMAKEEFTFSSDMTLLGSSSNQSTSDHMGSANFMASTQGTYTITARGIQTDTLNVEIVDPATWKISENKDIWTKLFIEEDQQSQPLDKFCLMPNKSMMFNPILLDKQNRKLSGTIPKIVITSDNESITIHEKEKAFELSVGELESPSKLKLEAQNVYGETIFSLNELEVCLAKEADIKGLDLSIVNNELDQNPDLVSRKELASFNKEAKRVMKGIKRSGMARIVLLKSSLVSENPIPNLEIEASLKGGLLLEIFDAIEADDDITTLSQTRSTVVTKPNTLLMALFPTDQDEIITFKSGQLEFQHIIPKTDSLEAKNAQEQTQ